MSADEKRLLEVCRLLNQYKAKYLVVGGMACNLHGLIRATKDIDLLIPKDVKNTERIIEALSEIGFGVARELIAEDVVKKPFTIIGDIPRIDLITVANKIKYEQAASTALKATIDRVRVPYVDYDNLVKSKQTDRLQDKADLETLRRIQKGK